MDLQARLQHTLGESYTLDRELGGGGMSRVFVATDTRLGRSVVVKVLSPELAEGLSAERFHREIQLAARLQHPGIVPLLSAGEAEGLPFYTMPYVEGESLRARLMRQGELPVREALAVLRDVARALAYAHAQGVVHRDIKPDNVLVSGDYAVVTDFGVAKAVSAARAASDATALTAIGVALGTPAYMAPEQAMGDEATDHRADLYAFGVLAYELLAGEPPFTGRSMQALLAAHATQTPVPLATRRAAVPAALAELVARCLEKRPADRPQSADEIVRALDALIAAAPSGETLATATVPIARGEQSPTAARRRVVRGTAIATVAALVIVAGVFAALRNRAPASLDPNLIVVAPFRVTATDPAVRSLREGIADLVAMKLTGALRPIDQRTVLAAWRGSGGDGGADPSADRALAITRELRARHLLEGTVLQTPRGDLEISATLLDARSGQRLATATASGVPSAVAMMVDTLLKKILVLQSGEGEAAATSLAETPWPALQAFLAGQSAYRAGRYAEAVDAFTRAIDIDSTFALAAYRLWLADGWALTGKAARGSRLAQLHRDRLDSLGRIMVPAPRGDLPPRSCEEALASREEAVRFAPDSPEAWYSLADHLFHCGPQMSIEDAWGRALVGFNRALALDSTFTPATEHLSTLHAEAGDTATALRWVALADTAGDYAAINRYLLTGDDAPVLRQVGTSNMAGPAFAAYLGVILRGDLAVADTILRLFRARTVTSQERKDVAELEYYIAMDRGQPRRGAAAGVAFDRIPGEMLLDRFFWDGDSAELAALAPAVRATASRPAPADPVGQDAWLAALLATGEEGIVTRNTAAAVRARDLLAAFRGATPVRTLRARHYALLLDAQVAVLDGRGDARDRVAALDSVLRRGEASGKTFEATGNLVVSRLWENLGETRRALVAARRQRMGPEIWPFFSTITRERARIAAAAGEREEAIRFYRQYIAMRAQPEASQVADLEAAKRELERLLGQSGGR